MRTLALAALAAAPVLADQTFHDIPAGDNTTIRATLTWPDGADLKQPIPVVIVFPPGPQNGEMEAAARAMFHAECLKRGWALVTPRPPEGVLFFQKPGLYKALVDDLDKTFVPQGGKYAVAGASNGGRSALNFALELPARTACVAAFPGAWLNPPPEKEAAERLKGIPIRLWVGGDDTVEWVDATRGMEAFAQRSGGRVDVRAVVVPTEGHVIRSLTGAAVMDEIERMRATAKPAPVSRASLDAHAVIDALHAAASKADFDAYFALFAPEGVFIGTDAGERWTVEQFKAYAGPVFARGQGKGGWTYVPRPGTRHVTVIPGAAGQDESAVAFFDELLDNESYGTTRGTGVLRRVTVGKGESARTEWKVAQYSLSIPIPNPIARRVAAMVKTEERKK
ncbi:MAG: nuclear transport factor 2 family protein [Phycisphaerales bacterium]|nr:nuclear transport factor 2 family protein [Phycisphaerales bacterium]